MLFRSRVAAGFSSYDGDLSLPLGLALGSPIFPSGCAPSPLLIATGESIPLLCVEGVPGLPGAPQDEIPVVTRESRRNSRKTTWFPPLGKMRPLPCSGGLRPLVELCVEPAGLCGRCPGGFSRVAAGFSSYDGDLMLPLGLALG